MPQTLEMMNSNDVDLHKRDPTERHPPTNLRGVLFMLIEQRIVVIGGTSGIGFAVESEGLHSTAWRVGQPGDAF